MKYHYKGTDERYLPTHKVLVKPDETIEVDEPINNPDFELVEKKSKDVTNAKK